MCEVCNDRKYTLDSSGNKVQCQCQLLAEILGYTNALSKYSISPNVSFDSIPNQAIFVNGSEAGFFSYVRTYLSDLYIKTRQNTEFSAISAGEVVERYVGNDTEYKHTELYHTPLLFLNLTRYYKNRVMGEIITHILRERDNLHFWVYQGDLSEQILANVFGGEFVEYLLDFDRINISKFSMELSQC